MLPFLKAPADAPLMTDKYEIDVDIGERAASGFIPRPDFRGLISIVCHSELPSEW